MKTENENDSSTVLVKQAGIIYRKPATTYEPEKNTKTDMEKGSVHYNRATRVEGENVLQAKYSPKNDHDEKLRSSIRRRLEKLSGRS